MKISLVPLEATAQGTVVEVRQHCPSGAGYITRGNDRFIVTSGHFYWLGILAEIATIDDLRPIFGRKVAISGVNIPMFEPDEYVTEGPSRLEVKLEFTDLEGGEPMAFAKPSSWHS